MALFSSSAHAEEAKHFNGGTSGGRYQLIQLSEYRRDQYLIDTQTGKLWKPTCSKAGADGMTCDGIIAWELQLIEGITADPAKLQKAMNGN